MMIDLVEYIGQVKNDTGVLGKAFMFKAMTEKDDAPYTFETILFVHDTVPSFISTAPEDDEFDKDAIIQAILDKYPKETLLAAQK